MSWRNAFWVTLFLYVPLVWSSHALAWGDVAHRLAAEEAIEALPGPLKGFYEKREAQLMQQLEDLSIGAPRWIFEVDSLEAFPFDDLPVSRDSAIEKYGAEKVEEVGDLPWRLIETYQKLEQAFQKVELEAIDLHSAEIVLYLNDLHQPLNLSKYGDGALTGQDGFRSRLDSRLIEIYGNDLRVKAPAAIYLDNPDRYLISILVRSFVWMDNLLLIDYFSNQGTSSYDRFYYEGLWLRAEGIVNERLSDSSKDIASYWYTAWTKAGKPKLP
ncbi:MAG: hypothetical protein ACRD1X_05530 [Vicinamibacteria bacterium]